MCYNVSCMPRQIGIRLGQSMCLIDRMRMRECIQDTNWRKVLHVVAVVFLKNKGNDSYFCTIGKCDCIYLS